MSFLGNCTSGGCGAKIGAGELRDYLKAIPNIQDPNLLVGFDASDDGAVYKINEEQAIVSTTDFFPPMVEDPKIFGKIAAANAMSDIYAMGGQVLFALNLVCFPQKMDKRYLAEMLAGGAEKVLEAGASIAGGHSIYDHEPKYGLAVTGMVSPKSFLQNNTPKAGDVIILTKALGTGVIQSAGRAGAAKEVAEKASIASMERLNKYAAEKRLGFEVHACTDVTGFGLLGHLSEMAGNGCSIQINTKELPLLPTVKELIEAGWITAGGKRNRKFVERKVDLQTVDPIMQEVLFDPQTSGGLLFSVDRTESEELLELIQRDDPAAKMIGHVLFEPRDLPIVLV
ncbi:MAG: selenide, water dikinase SelD [Lachnospiraceae bacterium]|nr:selenide, water dikinase SelD [Lachnospiraceae bacterium]